MEFIKSWKFMAIVIAVLFVVVGVLLVIGITTHTEPGLEPGAPQWDRSSFPLVVCPHAYLDQDAEQAEARIAVQRAVDMTNGRLDFAAMQLGDTAGHCDIRILLGEPQEAGWMDQGGDARLYQNASGVSCDVRTSNVFGELLDLTLQHELGHCLGLAHDDFDTSIMRPVLSTTPDRQLPPWITDYDRRLLRDLYAPMRE